MQQLEAILEATIDLFAEKKFNFSMNELAKRSGLGSASSLYRYISSKKDLWALIHQRDFEGLGKGMYEAGTKETDPDQAIHSMGNFFIEYAIEDFNRLERMFLTPPPEDHSEGDNENQLDIDIDPFNSLEMLIQTVQSALKKNDINDDPVLVSHYLWALVLGASILMTPTEQGFASPFLTSMAHAKEFKTYVLDKSRRLYSKS